ncbi:MAG: hypothetical protein ACYS30_16490 [Planctomycetota bacterium]
MNELLTQIILAARRRGTEGWMKILFPVLLAIFWVVGGILKARANKTKQKGEEQLTSKPGFKPSDKAAVAKPKAIQKILSEQLQRSVGRTPYRKKDQPQIQPPRRKIARTQPAVRKVAAEEEKAIPLRTIELLEEPELPVPTPQVQPDLPELQKIPEFARKTAKELGDMRVRTPAETPRTKYLSEILLDYADPEDLKRAILHYEILGRPLSLRNPSQHIIGL